MINNGIVFEKELDNLINSSNLPVELVYNIIRVKQLQLKQLYLNVLNSQVVLQEQEQEDQKEEE